MQSTQKRGKRSTAQKVASARHDFDPMPATSPVAGAFGKRNKQSPPGETPTARAAQDLRPEDKKSKRPRNS